MKLISSLLFVALVACGGKKDKDQPPPTTASGSSEKPMTTGSGSAQAGSGSGSAMAAGSGSGSAIVIPPYTPAADVAEPIKKAIAADDRTDADRALDAGRKPGEVFTFFKIAEGQKIGELFAGGGYSTEIMARIVGPKGKIYAQNSKEILDKFARKPWEERAARPVNKDIVVGLERPIDDPFGADIKDLDAVVTILNYHDAVWQKADIKKMNKAVFDALKPGGIYAIVDHSAKDRTGANDAETLHRIEQKVVVDDVKAAGFTLDAESDVLKHADDKRDWSTSPRVAGEKRGTSDRFTLRFVKPKK